jgi:chorismate mutase
VPGDRRLVAIRGAIDVDANTTDAMTAATTQLVNELAARNRLAMEDIVSAIFTVTPDLDAMFPALAARAAGWPDVPLLCTIEIDVPGALPKCIRVLVHAYRDETAPPAEHVYLGGAIALRPDLHGGRATGASGTNGAR